MAFDRAKLINALDKVKKYYGISSVEDLLRTIALQSVIQNPTEQQPSTRPIDQANQIEKEILETFFEDRTALYSGQEIISTIANKTTDQDILSRFNQTFQMFNEQQVNGMERLIHDNGNGTFSFLGASRTFSPISRIVSMPSGSVENRIFNRGVPTKVHPGLSVFMCNTHRLSFNQFYGDLLTVWLNGIPTHEIAKATPFFTIEFNTPRTAIDNQGRLSAMGLNKFIYGAASAPEGSSFFVTTKANQSSLTIQGEERESTIAGMELFTSPVSLSPTQNLTTVEHSARVLEPLQPFLTIEDLAINVAPSTGLMSFKRAVLTMRLHDRSRLADIAEFIRPEYYGLNEIMIEYGWIHPDAELSANPEENPYADIINNIRVKEKYGIVNSSYTFDGASGVKISLDLAMRGSTEMFTETIASSQDSLQNIMEEIQLIRGTIDTIRSRFPDGRVMGREIRGFDVINNLSDSSFNFTVGREFLQELTRIRTTISRVPQLSELTGAINRLIAQDGNSGLIRNVQRTILGEIQAKIENLIGGNTEDPMLLVVNDSLVVEQASIDVRRQSGTYAELPRSGPGSQDITNALRTLGVSNIDNLPNGQFSLAKLLLEFVGVPLAATTKYDDIQFVFYPFNVYAGRANRINIGNFGIDAKFFVIKYMEWRLGRLNQSLNVSLHEFMRFVIDQIVAEPSSKSYGLYVPESDHGSGGGVRRGFRYYVENGSVQIRDVGPNTGRRGREEPDGGSYLQQISRALQNVTPNAEFRPPQIEFHIESLPLKTTANGVTTIDPSKTVLRIHVFDRAATSLESLSQLEVASRNNSVQNIGTAWTQAQSSIRNIGATNPDGEPRDRPQIPTNEEANRIVESAKQNLMEAIRRAQEDGIIRTVQAVDGITAPQGSNRDASESSNQVRYQFVGGPEAMREFFRKNSPHMLFGVAGTTVKNAAFHSLHSGNSELATVNMLRSSTRAELQSNGENPGGLPMQVSPGQCELTILGNPLISYAQSLFCDFQTGTTIDNFYAIISIKHSLSSGKFETKLELTPVDGWGKYINIENVINSYAQQIAELDQQSQRQLEDLRQANRQPTTSRRR